MNYCGHVLVSFMGFGVGALTWSWVVVSRFDVDKVQVRCYVMSGRNGPSGFKKREQCLQRV